MSVTVGGGYEQELIFSGSGNGGGNNDDGNGSGKFGEDPGD